MNIFIGHNNPNSLFTILEFVVLTFTSIFGFYTYYRSRKKDSEKISFDIVSFFRENILGSESLYIKTILEKENEGYEFKFIKLDELDLSHIMKNQGDEFREQMRLSNRKLMEEELSILNKIEEISLKITHYNLENSKLIFSIKKLFVQVIETHAYALLFSRQFLKTHKNYSKTLQLYNLWKDSVDRRSVSEIHESFNKTISKISFKD